MTTVNAIKSKKPTKTATANRNTIRWMAWREAGHEPTRAECIALLKKHNTTFKEDAASMARDERDPETGKPTCIDSNLSFLAWDILVNRARAIDYSPSRNYLAGLLQQAHNYTCTVTRETLQLESGAKIVVPKYVSKAGGGVVLLKRETKQVLEAMAAEFVERARQQMLRWKSVGASLDFMKATLHTLEETVVEAY